MILTNEALHVNPNCHSQAAAPGTPPSPPAPPAGAPAAEGMAGVWRSRAEELTLWTEAHLVNRRDVWGGYTHLDRRGKPYTKADGALGVVPATLTFPSKSQRGKRLLHDGDIRCHYHGARPDHVIGLHTTSPDNTCRWGATESDVHGEGSESPEVIFAANAAWYRRLTDMGISTLMTDSNGKGGIHLRAIFSEPAPSQLVYAFFRWLIADHATYGLDRGPEVFPKQPRLDPVACEFGNWLRLPGRHHTREQWSRVWDGERWLEGHAAIDLILTLKPSAPRILWDALGLDPAAGVAGIPDEMIGHRRVAVAASSGHAADDSSPSGSSSCHRRHVGCARDPVPPEVFRQAQAWLERQPVSVERKDGSGKLMWVLRGLWTGWLLSEGQIWDAIRPWNGRCQPPWPDDQLAHKIADVQRTPDPRGRPGGFLRSDYDAGRQLPQVDTARLFAGLSSRRRQASPVPAAGGDGASTIAAREAMPDISDFFSDASAAARPDDEVPVPAGVSVLRDLPPCAEPLPERPCCHRYKVRLRCGNRYLFVGVPCDSWCCDECCDWLKATWARRVRYHVSLLHPDATVYLAYVTFGNELNSAQKAVNRAGGAYAHVLDERTCQRLFLATTPFRGAEAVAAAEALRRVEDAIAALTAGCSVDGSGFVRPVVCCRRWPEPPEAAEEEPQAGEDWVWDGRMSDEMDFDAALRVLHSWGIHQFANRDSGRRRYLVFEVPEDFTTAERGELWRCLEFGLTREEMRAAGAIIGRAFERLHEGARARTGADGG
jgi:hypothetical protein